MVEALLSFAVWTLVLWLMHRYAHEYPTSCLGAIHAVHHARYFEGAYEATPTWWLLVLGLQTTDRQEVCEQIVMELVPTVAICAVTGQWWIAILYWIDNALISHWTDHNAQFRLWWFAHGVFHTDHHETPNKNYGVYTVLWDVLFGTFQKPRPA